MRWRVARCYPSEAHQQRGQHPSACGVREPSPAGCPCVPWHAPAEAPVLELLHPQAELPRYGQATGRRKAKSRGRHWVGQRQHCTWKLHLPSNCGRPSRSRCSAGCGSGRGWIAVILFWPLKSGHGV